MMRRLYSAALLLLLPASAQAQSVVQNAWYDLKHAGLDVIHVWTGPFHGSKSDWAMFGVVIGGSAALSLLDDDIDAWLAPRQEGFVGDFTRAFRDSPLVHFGSGHRVMKVAALVWGAGLAFETQALRDAGMGCMAAIQGNAIIRSVLYRSISRTRPLVANGDQYEFALGDGGWDYHAFPGGHGANAHACAAFLAHRFDLDWPAYILHGVAAGVSIGRLVDRRHWTSDAIIGGAMGVTAGRTIAARSRNRADARNTPSNDRNDLSLEVIPTRDAVIVAVRLRF